MTRDERRVIFASSLGTAFEWYDFYLYGAMADIVARKFFTGLDQSEGFVFALLAFGAGFVVRPFGALLFGRLGDMIGRKYTFLVTILLMGMSTFIVGLLPGYAEIGVAAPLILIIVRLLQGLALGGEYGGAATYVAEHAPRGRCGAYTAWVQSTATLGLLLSLLVNFGLRRGMGEAAFLDWGWRLPFLASIVLLGISIWIRLRLGESPAFMRIKREGRVSRAPLREAFGNWANLKMVLIALFGLTAGQGAIWYCGQFYALFFLTQTLKLDGATASLLIGVALLIATPFFLLFGSLSDRIGRKPVVLSGFVLAALSYWPLFHGLTAAANPGLAGAQARAPVVLVVDPAQCSFLFDPTGTARFATACDIAKQTLAAVAVDYSVKSGPGAAQIRIGAQSIAVFDARGIGDEEFAQQQRALQRRVESAIAAAGYPLRADAARVNAPLLMLILFLLGIGVAAVYAPVAATLVELFPTRIRYSSLSLPYHIGNGWFGGLLPTIAFALAAQRGSIYGGLWYPIGVAAMSCVVALLFLPETAGTDLYAGD